VLAVPGSDTDLASGPVSELAAVLRVDNPAVDVRAARIDGGGRSDPSDIRAVLDDAAARRPAGAPCAVVIPLLATPNPPVTRRLREVVAASGVNAVISGFVNSNALIAEVLHIRLAEAGLARADRVRLFSIVTAADGILILRSAARTPPRRPTSPQSCSRRGSRCRSSRRRWTARRRSRREPCG
jgi:hypothetical protein